MWFWNSAGSVSKLAVSHASSAALISSKLSARGDNSQELFAMGARLSGGSRHIC